MKNSSKYRNIIFILILPCLLIFVGYFFLYKQLVKMSGENAQLLEYIASASSREVYTSNIQKQLQNSDADIKKIESAIVPSGDVVSFIEELESVAKANGLVIKNDSITEEQESNSKQASTTTSFLKIKSQIGGSWEGTYKFIAELESLPHKVRINSINFGSSGDSIASGGSTVPVTGSWTAVFEIRVLKYK